MSLSTPLPPPQFQRKYPGYCRLLQGVSMSTSLEVPPASALADPGAATQEAAESGATIPVWTCTICSVPYRKTLSKFWKPWRRAWVLSAYTVCSWLLSALIFEYTIWEHSDKNFRKKKFSSTKKTVVSKKILINAGDTLTSNSTCASHTSFRLAFFSSQLIAPKIAVPVFDISNFSESGPVPSQMSKRWDLERLLPIQI